MARVSDWREQQRSYWNSIASYYDELYQSCWSQLEDAETTELLDAVVPQSPGKILELACGTGLGYRLCLTVGRPFEYTGIDISENMLSRFAEKHPSIRQRLHQGSMSDLSSFGADTFDAVIAIYTCVSFVHRPMKMLREVHRVLRPSGAVFLSFANRWALRRLIRLQFRRVETFKTRGAEAVAASVPAITYSSRQVGDIVTRAGFSSIAIHGQSILGGLYETPRLWSIDHALSKRISCLCHTLNALAIKP